MGRLESASSESRRVSHPSHGWQAQRRLQPKRAEDRYTSAEKRITAKLPLLHNLLTATEPATDDDRATAGAATPTPSAATPEEVPGYLRIRGLELAYDPRTRTLEAPLIRSFVYAGAKLGVCSYAAHWPTA